MKGEIRVWIPDLFKQGRKEFESLNNTVCIGKRIINGLKIQPVWCSLRTALDTCFCHGKQFNSLHEILYGCILIIQHSCSSDPPSPLFLSFFISFLLSFFRQASSKLYDSLSSEQYTTSSLFHYFEVSQGTIAINCTNDVYSSQTSACIRTCWHIENTVIATHTALATDSIYYKFYNQFHSISTVILIKGVRFCQ